MRTVILTAKTRRTHVFYNMCASPTIGTYVFYNTFASPTIGTYVFYDTFASTTIGTYVFYDTFKLLNSKNKQKNMFCNYTENKREMQTHCMRFFDLSQLKRLFF